MISQTTEYALRAVVCLAGGDGRHQTVDAIAAAAKIPVGYLAKIMLILSRAGIVSSQRGIHGGFALRIVPENLSMFDVIQAVDPLRRFSECPIGPDGHGTNLCPLHRCLDSMASALAAHFRAITIASLVGPGTFGVCAREGGAPVTDRS
jgi:Rrf2 family nitric oxide-sensitive transcriptional repressor